MKALGLRCVEEVVDATVATRFEAALGAVVAKASERIKAGLPAAVGHAVADAMQDLRSRVVGGTPQSRCFAS